MHSDLVADCDLIRGPERTGFTRRLTAGQIRFGLRLLRSSPRLALGSTEDLGGDEGGEVGGDEGGKSVV